MGDYVAVVLSWALTTATCFFLVIRDERRRAPSSRKSAAILAFLAFVVYVGVAVAAYGYLTSLVLLERLPPPWPILGASGALVFGAASTAAIYVDERRFDPAHLERAWPTSSRAAAIVAFSQIAIVVHFWKTRRWAPLGFLLGCAWLGLSFLPLLALDFVLGLVFPDMQ